MIRTPTAIRKELARLMARGAREVEAERKKAAFTQLTKIGR